MRTTPLLSAAALAGLVAASPAPQQLDFAQISAAPAVQSGHSGVALNQTVTLQSTVNITTTATAAASGVTKRDVEKRTLGLIFGTIEYWNCVLWKICPATPSTSTTSKDCETSTTAATVKMTSPAVTSSWSSLIHTSSAVPTSSAVTPSTSSKASSSSSIATSWSSSTAGSSFSVAAQRSSSVEQEDSISITASSTIQTSSGTSTTTSSTECATSIEAGTYCGFINPEDPCSPQPGGYGPVPSPDTVAAFESYAPFHAEASAAPSVVASSEQGVEYTQVFRDLNASVNAASYIGLYTLTSYNTTECASLCDKTNLCTSFNLYIERDPSVNPSANDSTASTVWGYWCPDPASITNYKCTLWGSSLDSSEAVNYGEYREQFHTVITASNGYDKTNDTVPVCSISSSSSAVAATGSSTAPITFASATSTSVAISSSTSSVTSASVSMPAVTSSASSSSSGSSTGSRAASWGTGTNCGGKAIDSTKNWMGSKFFPGPFNAQLCADYAWAQNLANQKAAVSKGLHSFTPCKSFNSYYLHKNGSPFGTYCNL
ncbi:hypothetical protein BDV97DRAFT_151820 [Delphinella strobiligena]|nr:hypothetical protein BDV97DRAFT_151820 [Delphinella strobiligena]